MSRLPPSGAARLGRDGQLAVWQSRSRRDYLEARLVHYQAGSTFLIAREVRPGHLLHSASTYPFLGN